MIKRVFNLLIYLQPFAKYMLVTWLITIVILSSLPSSAFPSIKIVRIIVRIDYLVHFLEYSFLSWLTLYTFAGRELNPGVSIYFKTSVALSLFAVADELHQLLIPSRSFSGYDMLADFVGILTAAALFFLITHFGRSKEAAVN